MCLLVIQVSPKSFTRRGHLNACHRSVPQNFWHRSVGTYIHVLVLSIYSKYIVCVHVLQHSNKQQQENTLQFSCVAGNLVWPRVYIVINSGFDLRLAAQCKHSLVHNYVRSHHRPWPVLSPLQWRSQQSSQKALWFVSQLLARFASAPRFGSTHGCHPHPDTKSDSHPSC